MEKALPGVELIDAGLADLREGRETLAALLVAIGAPRLRRIGVEIPDDLPDNPEYRLYSLLAEDDSDSAHSRYNAYLRRLTSFEHTAEHALNEPSPNPEFRAIVDSILNVDFADGVSTIRADLKYLQSL